MRSGPGKGNVELLIDHVKRWPPIWTPERQREGDRKFKLTMRSQMVLLLAGKPQRPTLFPMVGHTHNAGHYYTRKCLSEN